MWYKLFTEMFSSRQLYCRFFGLRQGIWRMAGVVKTSFIRIFSSCKKTFGRSIQVLGISFTNLQGFKEFILWYDWVADVFIVVIFIDCLFIIYFVNVTKILWFWILLQHMFYEKISSFKSTGAPTIARQNKGFLKSICRIC